MSRQIAELVATEFFEQGDKERRELNIEPIVSSCFIERFIVFYETGQQLWKWLTTNFTLSKDLMNREKQDKIPSMQVSFIDAICTQLYEVHVFWSY